MCHAHDVVYQAKKKGLLVPQPCERCGARNVHAHHEDYDKPLEVLWLCPSHHRVRHSEMRAELAVLASNAEELTRMARMARAAVRKARQ